MTNANTLTSTGQLGPVLTADREVHTPTITQKTITVPRLLTQKEAAELTRMSEKWLERDRWVERRIPYVKIGRAIRYRAEDIAAYIDANVQGAA